MWPAMGYSEERKEGKKIEILSLQFHLTPSHSWKMMNSSSMFTVDISCVNSGIIYFILIHPHFLVGFKLFVHPSQKSHFITLFIFKVSVFLSLFSLTPFLVFDAVAFFPTKTVRSFSSSRFKAKDHSCGLLRCVCSCHTLDLSGSSKHTLLWILLLSTVGPFLNSAISSFSDLGCFVLTGYLAFHCVSPL